MEPFRNYKSIAGDKEFTSSDKKLYHIALRQWLRIESRDVHACHTEKRP